jgi:hypothetical protein
VYLQKGRASNEVYNRFFVPFYCEEILFPTLLWIFDDSSRPFACGGRHAGVFDCSQKEAQC